MFSAREIAVSSPSDYIIHKPKKGSKAISYQHITIVD
jgi:hypothetical protein